MKTKGKLVYITEHGSKLGISADRLYVKEKGSDDKKFINLISLEGLIIGANISISSKLLSKLPEYGVTCIFLDSIKRFSGKIEAQKGKNVFARKYQARLSSDKNFVLSISKKIVKAKIEAMNDCYFDNDLYAKVFQLDTIMRYEQILGVEGSASKIYFKYLRKDLGKLNIPFFRRSYYPPEDEGNALLSLAYTLLMTEVSIIVNLFDLDLGWGFLHRDYYGRDGLICDLMEPFRSAYADKYVLEFIKSHSLTCADFSRENKAVSFSNLEKKRLFYREFREVFMNDMRRDNILFFVREIYNHIVEDGETFFKRNDLLA